MVGALESNAADEGSADRTLSGETTGPGEVRAKGTNQIYAHSCHYKFSWGQDAGQVVSKACG